MKKTTNYNELLNQIKNMLQGRIDINDGSPEFGLLWHINGLVTKRDARNNTATHHARSTTTEGMIRQSTKNPL